MHLEIASQKAIDQVDRAFKRWLPHHHKEKSDFHASAQNN